MRSSLLFGAVALLATTPARADSDNRRAIQCDVVIVGGGAGGLHTAYRLGPRYGRNVCLFEKENRLGGRIYDVPMTPGGPVFGTGAMRIMETQDVVFALADELGIQYEAAPFRDDLLSVRGHFGYSSDEINASAFPLVPDNVTETDLYDRLRFGPERANAHRYPDFRSYVRKVAGEQGYHFLTDVFRFRADFEYTLDARGYLDYLDEEWDVCCTPSYPVGGMSEFIKRMEARTRAQGVRVYLGEPAIEINGSRRGYTIDTPSYRVSASHVVIAVDAYGFAKVGGNIARAIQAQQQFQDLVGVKVVTVAQWWPNKWWENAIPGKDIRRAWTTEHCLNAMEIPIQQYAAQQNVTRTVYDDDIRCVTFWENTLGRGLPEVEKEINRGLQYLFPGVTIPQPLKTHVQIWPAGWYWLKGGSRFTNADIASWAVSPLPGENVALVGESYNPQRSGWSDGAYKSSLNTLDARFSTPTPPPPGHGHGHGRGRGPRRHGMH